MNDNLFLLPIVAIGICALGLMRGGGIKEIQAGHPSRQQSAWMIGMGLSFGAFSFLTSGTSPFGTCVITVGSIAFVVVGIMSYFRAAAKK